jgi:cell division protein FtsN
MGSIFMHKNPNFEWKPVSTGNEKFMIVLSWLIVAFIVIVVGLYYGQSGRIKKVALNSSETITANAETSIGQGEIKNNPKSDKNLDKSVLGKNEVYTIMLGNSSDNLTKSKAASKLKVLIKEGYTAKSVEIDSRNQRYVIYAGKFDSYMEVTSTLKKLNHKDLPGSVYIVSREVASTYLSGEEVKKNNKNFDPLNDIITTNRRGSVIDNSNKSSANTTNEAKNVTVSNNVDSTSKKVIETKNLLDKATKKIAENKSTSTPISLNKYVPVSRIENSGRKTESEIIESEEDLSLDETEKKSVTETARTIGSGGNYKLQLATFGTMKYAANYKNKLEKAGFSPVNIKQSKSSKTNKTWYVVRIEGFESSDDATEFATSVLNKYDSKIKPLIRK